MNHYAYRIRIPAYRGYRQVMGTLQAAHIGQAVQLLALVVVKPLHDTHIIKVERIKWTT